MRKPRPEYDHERELRRFMPTINRLGRMVLVNKKIEIQGQENFVNQGPSILIGNHCGAYKDVSTLFRIASRPIFFNANRQLFTHPEFSYLVRKHLHRHMGRIGDFINFILNPYKWFFVDYISSNIARVGAIPVDLLGSKKAAIAVCENYLRRGRAIVSLQGRGRVDPSERNPYMKPFGRGMALVAYEMSVGEGMDVPVTPLALFGTQLPWMIPGTIRVHFGEPMFARDHLRDTREASVEAFKDALERKVDAMIRALAVRR
jgi:1-acyl-sn-glycerol-3-phosphate acyltransferase